ncbi:MAG: DNA-3-methyladenine glycosylase [Saprospiraceae bacterium]|nr:DNA-3-methyladenine glycosylase [Saprospiraceae bacterium]
MILPENFYQSEDVVAVARQLLGKVLITRSEGIESTAVIVETEAYRAPDDKACHAYGNRFTQRTKTMFMEGGTVYIYTCYGIHPMFNVVTGREGQAHAVLVRAVELLHPGPHFMQRRKLHDFSPVLANGPGKLTIALGINKSMNGVKLFDPESPVTLQDHDIRIPEEQIVTSCRVGMSVHTGPCAHRPWRFYIRDNAWVSKPAFPDYSYIIPDKSYKN